MESGEEIQTIALEVSGRVQGVGFRYFCHRAAHAFQVQGYARNLPDGSVYIEVTGTPLQLGLFRAEVSKGPARARVDSLQTRDLPLTDYNGFQIR